MNENDQEMLRNIMMKSDGISKQHLHYLLPICEAYGYGATLHEASQAWIEKDPIGAKVIGPCNAMVVPCGCKKPHKCKWCCGCGWLTKHVKEVKDKK